MLQQAVFLPMCICMFLCGCSDNILLHFGAILCILSTQSKAMSWLNFGATLCDVCVFLCVRSDKNQLHFRAILSILGARYMSCCSNIIYVLLWLYFVATLCALLCGCSDNNQMLFDPLCVYITPIQGWKKSWFLIKNRKIRFFFI